MRHLTSSPLLYYIESRFQQPGYTVYYHLEDVLVKAANKENYEEDLDFSCRFYKKDFNQEQLEMQLDMIASNLPDKQFAHDLQSVLQYILGNFLTHI